MRKSKLNAQEQAVMNYLSVRTDALLAERRKREKEIAADGAKDGSFSHFALKKINAQFDALVQEMHDIADYEPVMSCLGEETYER